MKQVWRRAPGQVSIPETDTFKQTLGAQNLYQPSRQGDYFPPTRVKNVTQSKNWPVFVTSNTLHVNIETNISAWSPNLQENPHLQMSFVTEFRQVIIYWLECHWKQFQAPPGFICADPECSIFLTRAAGRFDAISLCKQQRAGWPLPRLWPRRTASINHSSAWWRERERESAHKSAWPRLKRAGPMGTVPSFINTLLAGWGVNKSLNMQRRWGGNVPQDVSHIYISVFVCWSRSIKYCLQHN